jgi:RHS repeat-associated protein
LHFDYDAEGRRYKKSVTRYAEGAIAEQKVVYFIWDGWDLLFERHEDVGGNPLLERRYVWGPDIADGAAGGAGGLLLIRETRGQTTTDYYPLYDGTGHVTGLADSAANLSAEYWYGPFGELIHASGEMAQANPWRYATKYFDTETGLYYFGHRYYDPLTGQWLNREPLGEDESLNLYAYCQSDPVNKVDRLGLDSIAINSDGVVEWLIKDPGTGILGLFQNVIRRIPVGTVSRSFEMRGNAGGYVNGNTVLLHGGGTVPLSELRSFTKANPASSESSHWRWNSYQSELVGILVSRAACGAADSENGFSEFAAGAHDRASDLVNGLYGLALRDGLLGTDFMNWSRWRESSGSIQGAWANLYGNTLLTNSGSQVRQSRWDWHVNEDTRFYQGGGTSFDVVTIAGPVAWTRIARVGAAKTGTWGAGGSGYTLNPFDLARKDTIFSRAEGAGITVDRSLAAGQSGGLIRGVPTMRVQPFSSSTVAIEEYLHARFAERMVNRHGVEGAQRMMADPAFMLQQELRLKSRMIGAGERGVLGSRPMDLNIDFLRETRAGYQVLSP